MGISGTKSTVTVSTSSVMPLYTKEYGQWWDSVVGVSATNVNSNGHESSGSVTTSDDDHDRPWNRHSKKRRSSLTLVVPLDSLEDIPPMEELSDSSMSPQSLMNHVS